MDEGYSLQILVQDNAVEIHKHPDLPRLVFDVENIDLAKEVFKWVDKAGINLSELRLAVLMLEHIETNYKEETDE